MIDFDNLLTRWWLNSIDRELTVSHVINCLEVLRSHCAVVHEVRRQYECFIWRNPTDSLPLQLEQQLASAAQSVFLVCVCSRSPEATAVVAVAPHDVKPGNSLLNPLQLASFLNAPSSCDIAAFSRAFFISHRKLPTFAAWVEIFAQNYSFLFVVTSFFYWINFALGLSNKNGKSYTCVCRQ